MTRNFVTTPQAMSSLMDKPISWFEGRKTIVEFGNGKPVNYINENQNNMTREEFKARSQAVILCQ